MRVIVFIKKNKLLIFWVLVAVFIKVAGIYYETIEVIVANLLILLLYGISAKTITTKLLTVYVLYMVDFSFIMYAFMPYLFRDFYFYVPVYSLENAVVRDMFLLIICAFFVECVLVEKMFLQLQGYFGGIIKRKEIEHEVNGYKVWISVALTILSSMMLSKKSLSLASELVPKGQGIVVYFVKALLVVSVIVAFIFSENMANRFYFRTMISAISAIPLVLMGSRVAIILQIFVLLIFILTDCNYTFQFNIIKILLYLGMLLCGIYMMVEIASYCRNGEFINAFSWGIRRLVGFPDSANVLNYVLVEKHSLLGLKSFVLDTLKVTNGIAEFYTRDVANIPHSGNSVARPGIFSVYMYGGIYAVLIFGVISTCLLCFFENKLRKGSVSQRYICSYFYVIYFFNVICEGAVDCGLSFVVLAIIIRCMLKCSSVIIRALNKIQKLG